MNFSFNIIFEKIYFLLLKYTLNLIKQQQQVVCEKREFNDVLVNLVENGNVFTKER